MNIKLKYNNDIAPELHSKLEEARGWLCKVLESWEFKQKAEGFEQTSDYLRLINNFEANILIRDLSQINRPFAYDKEKKTVSVDPEKAPNKSIEQIAGYLAHEIGHQWFEHEGGSFGGFMGFLQYEIPKMTPNPTTIEKLAAWGECITVKLGHLIVAILGVPFLPLAYILKYWFKVKNVWLLNDTVDGDFGADWWLKETGYKNKLIRFIEWYRRNSVWNLKLLTAPKWNGEYVIQKIIKNDVGNPLTWVTQKDRGTNFAYYEVEGTLYFRFSHTNKYFNIQIGAAGERYNAKLRRAK